MIEDLNKESLKVGFKMNKKILKSCSAVIHAQVEQTIIHGETIEMLCQYFFSENKVKKMERLSKRKDFQSMRSPRHYIHTGY